jgi:hypothetical protein
MSLLPGFRLKKKQSSKAENDNIRSVVQDELTPYLKREDVQAYIKKIERDKNRKRIWDRLSDMQKLKLLRYVTNKRGGQDARKK